MKFKLTTIMPATPKTIYDAWLSSNGHSRMTRGDAKCSKRIGSRFNAWDGYIEGKNLELKEDEYIKQSWRTVEFKQDQPDSILEVLLEAKGKDQCKLTLIHSLLSPADIKYKQGWVDSYFEPMKTYWGEAK